MQSQGISEIQDLLKEVNDVAVSGLPTSRKLTKVCDIVNRATEILHESCSKETCVEILKNDVVVIETAVAIVGQEIDNRKRVLSNYNPVQFAESIANKVLEKDGYKCFFDVKMLGNGFIPRSLSAFDTFNPDERPPPKERQKRQKTNNDKDLVLTCPENIEKSVQLEETSEVLKKVEKLLQAAFLKNNREPLNYFKAVIDPNDFGKTIDNIFQVSFLIKDNSVALTYENSSLWLRPLTKSKKAKNKGTESGDFITQINMEQWRSLVKKYQIKKPIIDLTDRTQ